MSTPERFRIPVLVTLDDDSEELRHFIVEALSLDQAMRLAEERALDDEQVVEAKAQAR